MAGLLIDEGAEVDRANDYGLTPLYIAKSKGHERIVALLGGKMFSPRSAMRTLHAAAKTGDVGAITQLLDDGADIDQTNRCATPLFIACQMGQVDAARLLLDQGAEVDRALEDGQTPLIIACKNGHVDAVRLLLDQGTDINRADKYGATPLLAACSKGHVLSLIHI